MIRKAINLLLDKAHIVIGVFFFLTLFLGYFALSIPIDPSFSSLVSEDGLFNTNERILQNSLDQSDSLLIFFKPDESSNLLDRPSLMSDEEVVNYIDRVKDVVGESKYVTNILGPQFNDEEYYAQIVLQVDTPREIGGFRDVLNDVESKYMQVNKFPGVDATLTGFPFLLNRVNTLLIQDNIRTVLFTFVAVFLVLYFYFRNLRLTLITLSIPVVSLTMLAGFMTLFNIPITITLAVVGILTLGLGVDFAIHVLVGYETYLEDGFNHRDSIVEAIDHLHVAIFASLITTAAGFTALMFGVGPSSQAQGVVLTLSILLIGFSTVILLPSLLYLFGSGKLGKRSKLFTKIKDILTNLATFQTKYPKKVILGVGLITLVMIVGATQVGFSTSNENWIPDNDPVQESFRESSYAFGNDFSNLQLVVTSDGGDLRNVQTVRDIQRLSSIVEGVFSVNEVRGPFNDVALNQKSIYEKFKPLQEQGVFNKDYTITTLSVQVFDFATSDDGTSPLLDEVLDIIETTPVYNAQVSVFGDVVRFNELGSTLGRDTGVTTIISFVLVFLIASLTYLSLRVGFTAILPIVIGIIWTVGFMGFTNVPFTSLSTGLIALVLGIGIDFSIHLVNSIYNYKAKGMSLQKSIERTMTSSGGALLLTSISTFIGFISLTLATLLGIQRLGLSLAFAILSVFLVTIILVPAIISLGYDK